jgi:hypothetical protein
MFNKFDIQPQVEESYDFRRYCTCDNSVVCDLCHWVDSTMIGMANREFDMAAPVVEPWSFRNLECLK